MMREKCTVFFEAFLLNIVFFEAFLLNICVIKNFIVILQRETKDTNHSSAGKCIFCRSGGGNEGGGEDREGGGAEPGGKGGEEAEQGFAILLPHGKMGR